MNRSSKWQVSVLTMFLVAAASIAGEGAGATGGTIKLLVPDFQVKCTVKVTQYTNSGKIVEPEQEILFTEKNYEQSNGNNQFQLRVSPKYQENEDGKYSFGYTVHLMQINVLGTVRTISRNSAEAYGNPLSAKTTAILEIRDKNDKHGVHDLYQQTDVICNQFK